MIDINSLPDRDIVARTIDGEAGNQGFKGMQAVGNVIQNRVKLHWQGETTARGVCLHHAQFDCWMPGADLNRITADSYTPPNLAYIIADAVLGDYLPDITNGADSYCVTGTDPYWAKGLKPTVIIEIQSFYVTRKLPEQQMPTVEANVDQPEAEG